MIRLSNVNDFPDVYRLICLLENRSFDYESLKRIYHEQLQDERFFCFVYEKDHEVTGLLNMKMENHLHHCGKVMMIMEFVVQEESRSQGIGSELFEYAVSYAKEHGCVRIELETSMWREKAHAFYERHGMIRDHYYYTMNI
jgi:PhnO protein